MKYALICTMLLMGNTMISLLCLSILMCVAGADMMKARL